MRRNRRALSVPIVATSLVLLACSSDGDDEPTYTFKDAAGRSCTRTRSGVTATCDTPPTPVTACSGSATACYTASLGADIGPDGKQRSGRRVFKVCAACCSGNTSASAAADCADVVCTADTDCAAEGGTTCASGRCQTSL